MSIQSEINRINENIANTYSAFNDMGATMPATQNSANMASTVRTIPQSGEGSVKEIYYADFTVDFQNYAITGASTNYQTIVENIEAGKYVVGRGTYAFISSPVNIGYFPLTAYVKEQNMLIFSGFAQAMSGSTIVLLSLTIEIPSSNIPTVRARLVSTTDLK